MSTAKHTPGPWHINQHSEWILDIVTRHGELPDGSTACWNIASISTRRDEHQANAHLMSAAPELLEACKAIVAYDEDNESDSMAMVSLITRQ